MSGWLTMSSIYSGRGDGRFPRKKLQSYFMCYKYYVGGVDESVIADCGPVLAMVKCLGYQSKRAQVLIIQLNVDVTWLSGWGRGRQPSKAFSTPALASGKV